MPPFSSQGAKNDRKRQILCVKPKVSTSTTSLAENSSNISSQLCISKSDNCQKCPDKQDSNLGTFHSFNATKSVTNSIHSITDSQNVSIQCHDVGSLHKTVPFSNVHSAVECNARSQIANTTCQTDVKLNQAVRNSSPLAECCKNVTREHYNSFIEGNINSGCVTIDNHDSRHDNPALSDQHSTRQCIHSIHSIPTGNNDQSFNSITFPHSDMITETHNSNSIHSCQDLSHSIQNNQNNSTIQANQVNSLAQNDMTTKADHVISSNQHDISSSANQNIASSDTDNSQSTFNSKNNGNSHSHDSSFPDFDISNYIKLKTKQNTLQVTVNKRVNRALMDSGAEISCLTLTLLHQSNIYSPLQRSRFTHISGVGGEKHRVLGTITLPFVIADMIFMHTFEVLESLSHPMILGENFQRENDIIFRPNKDCLYVLRPDISSKSKHTPFSKDNDYHGLAKTISSITFAPGQEIGFPVSISNTDSGYNINLEPLPSLFYRHKLIGLKTLNTVTNGKGLYIARNTSNKQITLKPNTPVAKVDYVITDSIVNASEVIHSNKASHGKSISTLSSKHDNKQLSNSTTNKPPATPSAPLSRAEKIKMAKDLGIDLSDSILTANQQDDFLEFIAEYRQIFARDITELGLAKVPPYKIKLKPDAQPRALNPYPLTPEKRREMARQVGDMLQGNIIREIDDSPWRAPVCLAKKPNGQLRFTVDMRYCNSQIESENCIIPTAQEVFDTVADAKASVYTTLDMTSSFWQIPLHPDSQPLTTFGTPFGNFCYNRLPFGMKNSTIAFMSAMHKILRKSNFLYSLCYVDDLIIFSPDLDTHKLHLKQIFSVLSEAGFTLNPKKCRFAAKDVHYLSY